MYFPGEKEPAGICGARFLVFEMSEDGIGLLLGLERFSVYMVRYRALSVHLNFGTNLSTYCVHTPLETSLHYSKHFSTSMGNETLKSAVLERDNSFNLVEHLASPVLPFQARSSGHFRETTPNLSGRLCFVSRLAITCGASPPKMMEHEEIPIGLYLQVLLGWMGSISKYNRAIFSQHATTEGRFMYSNSYTNFW